MVRRSFALFALMSGCVTVHVPIETWSTLTRQVPKGEWKDLAVPATRARDGKPLWFRASAASTDPDEPDTEGHRSVRVINKSLVVGVVLAVPSALLLALGAGVYATPDPTPSPPKMCPANQFICGDWHLSNQGVGAAFLAMGGLFGLASVIVSAVGGASPQTRLRPAEADGKTIVRW